MRTIAAFTTIESAYLLRSRLEGSGVTAFVRDEFTVAANPLYANAIGGVKVEVADEDYARACEILDFRPEPHPAPSAGGGVNARRHPWTRYPFLGVVLFLILSGYFILDLLPHGSASRERAEILILVAFFVAALVAALAATLDL